MAITTLDGAIAGFKPPAYISKAASGTLVAARPFSPFYLAGSPGAATAPTTGGGTGGARAGAQRAGLATI